MTIFKFITTCFVKKTDRFFGVCYAALTKNRHQGTRSIAEIPYLGSNLTTICCNK